MAPRLITPGDPYRPTDGRSGALIAHLHGRPWLPWQRTFGDLAGTAGRDGRYAAEFVVAMIPRQCGKTTAVFDTAQGRCLALPDYRAAYTAQTGHVTSERFGERMAELGSTALARRVGRRRSAGTERMTFPRGSYLKAFPPKDGALRGSALDLVVIDECQEITELQGVALDQTILPVFTTRRRRQLILIGTAGTDMSAYFARYLALARGGAAGVFVIEYGATPDDDPADPAVWWRVHPGLAAGLTDEEALRGALAVMGPESFAREYLNVWSTAGTRIIPAREWNAARRAGARPRPGVAPVLAFDVAIDRSAGVIIAVWPDVDGCPVGEVVEYAPGVDWMAGRVRALRDTHRPPLVVADNQGPVLTVVDELRRPGPDGGRPVDIMQPTPKEFGAACASSLDRVKAGTVAHRGEQALDAAAAGAGRRTIGDGGWAWARRTSTVDVCPLVAYSLALWADQRRPVPGPRPAVYSD